MKLLLLLSLVTLALGQQVFVGEKSAESNDVPQQATTVLQAESDVVPGTRAIGDKKIDKRSHGWGWWGGHGHGWPSYGHGFGHGYGHGHYSGWSGGWGGWGGHGWYGGWYPGWPWWYGWHGGHGHGWHGKW